MALVSPSGTPRQIQPATTLARRRRCRRRCSRPHPESTGLVPGATVPQRKFALAALRPTSAADRRVEWETTTAGSSSSTAAANSGLREIGVACSVRLLRRRHWLTTELDREAVPQFGPSPPRANRTPPCRVASARRPQRRSSALFAAAAGLAHRVAVQCRLVCAVWVDERFGCCVLPGC